MKKISLIIYFMAACLLIIYGHIPAYAQKLPIIDGKEAVATVNNEPITLEDLNRAIASAHQEMRGIKSAGRIDYSSILKRLINVRLIVLEARNMGLDELPKIKNAREKYSRETLMELLLEDYTKDIEPEEREVEEIYKDMVKEWKIRSVLFKKEADAKRIEEEIKSGKDFDEVVKKAIKKGIAEGDDQGEYLKDKDLKGPVSRLVSTMEVGKVSPTVKTGKDRFILFQIEGIRYPEDRDPETRVRAKQQARNRKRVKAVKDYYHGLKERYINFDEKLFDDLDFEAKEPGFDNLLKDTRIIVTIKGEDPITVGDLANALKRKFHHGVGLAIEYKRVNKRKREILEDILQRRLLFKEALAKDIDKTEIYQNRVKGHEIGLIFGQFINRVVVPEIKLDMEELKRYYEEHIEEYTFPKMVTLKSLVFGKRSDAREVLNKLTKGTDFNWMASHAEGQVDEDTEGLIKFENRPLTIRSLPEGLRKVLSGSSLGDYSVYESPEGHHYVLYVYDVIPSRPQPFENVKEEIAKKVYNDKLKKAVGVWADRLREHYPVKIFREDLRG